MDKALVFETSYRGSSPRKSSKFYWRVAQSAQHLAVTQAVSRHCRFESYRASHFNVSAVS